jgi:hypothetical protein
MRLRILAGAALLSVAVLPKAGHADDAIARCKAFFKTFEQCVDGLHGEQQDEARIYMKTLRATLGLSDDLNQGDPMALGIMCQVTMDEIKKDSMVQKYNCAW